MAVELEHGKSYRLNNGWKMTVHTVLGVNNFHGRIVRYIDGKEDRVDSDSAAYYRNGTYMGAVPEYMYSVAGLWNEPSVSGPSRDIDGWDLDRYRQAINKSGLFSW